MTLQQKIARHLRSDFGSRALYFVLLLDVLVLAADYSWFFAPESAWSLSFALVNNPWAQLFGPLASLLWQATPLLFAAALAALVFGLVKRPTALTSLIVAFCLVWLQRRSLWILDAGDNFALLFLLWHALLFLAPEKLRFLFGLQLFLIYFENSLLKSGPTWTEWGTALNVLWGQSYLSYDWIKQLSQGVDLKWLTFAARYAEMLVPFLLLFRRPKYAAWFFLFYHSVIALTLRIELFPWINMAGWLLLLSPPTVTAPKKWPVVVAILWLASSYLQGINILFIRAPLSPRTLSFLDLSHLGQKWGMFSPSPRFTSYQYAIACTPGPCTKATQEWSDTPHWGRRRKQFMIRLAERKNGTLLHESFHAYLCRENPQAKEISVAITATVKDLRDPSQETQQALSWPSLQACAKPTSFHQ